MLPSGDEACSRTSILLGGGVFLSCVDSSCLLRLKTLVTLFLSSAITPGRVDNLTEEVAVGVELGLLVASVTGIEGKLEGD